MAAVEQSASAAQVADQLSTLALAPTRSPLVDTTNKVLGPDDLSKQDKRRFNELVVHAKQLNSDDAFQEALDTYRQAAIIWPSEACLKKITKLETIVQACFPEWTAQVKRRSKGASGHRGSALNMKEVRGRKGGKEKEIVPGKWGEKGHTP